MDSRLSVLDLSPVSSGSNGAKALHNTLDLARLADRLGYERYWLAEHHNLSSVASSAPEVMIGHVASETSRIRVGAGGIMLPNHAPLRVVETFRVLESLHPGRVDHGIGCAPGTDPVTATGRSSPIVVHHKEERMVDPSPQHRSNGRHSGTSRKGYPDRSVLGEKSA